jgi:2-iminobutanoate/2-iminopropanoate deaminase
MTVLQPIHTTDAPNPIGPYSQAIRWGDLIFTSGQIALSPLTGELQDEIDSQINQVFSNLGQVLKAANSSFAHVLKMTIFVTDLADFPKVNAAMEKYCQAPFPARSTVQVAALPKNAKVEIEVIATIST